MARHMEFENRSGPRYLATLEVKAEWDEPTGTHIVAEGTTENVGPKERWFTCRDNCPMWAARFDSRFLVKAATDYR